MSKDKWHLFPNEEPPKGKKLLVTEESAFSVGKFVSLKWWRSGSKEWFPDSWFATQTAWMQAPDPFVPKERKNRRRKRMTKANWHPFPQEKPDKEGFYLVTIKNNSTGTVTIDINFWGVHSFPKQIAGWHERQPVLFATEKGYGDPHAKPPSSSCLLSPPSTGKELAIGRMRPC